MKPTYILGAGGHAKALKWLYPDAILIPEGHEPNVQSMYDGSGTILVGFLGQSPYELEMRARAVGRLLVAGVEVSTDPQVLPGATVDPSVMLCGLTVVNQGAVVAHDCNIGYGSHIGPGAVLCGGVRVGAYSMVGAGAVVLPNSVLPSGTLVRAGTRYPR